MPVAMNTITATSERSEKRPSPHTPWPLVQPPPMRVPKPTRAPASASQPQPTCEEDVAGNNACQTKPAAIRPAMKAARHARSPGGWANNPCSIPLTPAMRPLAASSHTLASPISTPPARADSGVKLSKVIFRQLFDPQSSTYTYLLADEATREALLIDPLGLRLKWTLETHVHADHVTAAWLLREKLGSRIGTSKAGGADGADRY